jgi:hypothetical protein
MILTTLVPALLPAVSDGLRGLFARLTGGKGAMPQNIDEVVRIGELDIKRLEVLAKLDTPTGDIYKWAATARALQRPAMATIILGIYAYSLAATMPMEVVLVLGDYVSMVLFYLFGDKTYNAVKGSRK